MRCLTFVIAVLVMTLSNCKSLDKLTMFDLDYESDFIFQSGLPLNLPFSINGPDVTTNSEQEFAINDTRKDLIESILLKELKLTVTNPSGKSFSFLKSVSVFISAPGVQEVLVASKSNIADQVGGELLLDLSGVELMEYIKSDSFNLRVSATTDEILLSDVGIKINSIFGVDAKILGI